jgi:hypothetical protein
MNYTDKQYEMLREEIMQNLSAIHSLLTTTYVAIGAILSYAMINLKPLSVYFEAPMLFIPLFVVLVVIFARVSVLNVDIISMSTYMEVFLEPKLEDIKWETHLHKFEIRKSIFQRASKPNIVLVISLYFLFAYVLIVNFSIISLLIAGSINTVALIICFAFLTGSTNRKLRQSHFDEWVRIKHSQK